MTTEAIPRCVSVLAQTRSSERRAATAALHVAKSCLVRPYKDSALHLDVSWVISFRQTSPA
jgi:hypothetical protein